MSSLRGEGSSSSAAVMEDHADIAASLFALTPNPNSYMMKFLADAKGEQVPILGEYFGVALAFAALGSLMRETKVTPSPKLQGVGLQVMLKSAMDRLQALAVNARDLEQKVKDGAAWEAERRTLAQKLSFAEAEIAHFERTRQEDAKANAQAWRAEQTVLKREVALLRDEIGTLRERKDRECEECQVKLKELEKLEGQLCEREFLMAQEARADQHEQNLLGGKLAMVELCVSDLKEKLFKATAENAELREEIADLKRKHEETESKLMSERREMESVSAAKMNQNAIIEELLDNLKSLQKEVNEKEEVIAALTKKSNAVLKEREELFNHLAQTKSKRKAVETEKDRWKRLAEERARNIPAPQQRGLRRSLGSRAELDKHSEVQRAHTEEIQGLRSMYTSKLESLQAQLKHYEEKVTKLEEKILVHSTVKRKPKHDDRSAPVKKPRELMDCQDVVTLLESLTPDTMQIDGAEIQELPMTAGALTDWLKQWLEGVTTHHAQQLEKRHCRAVNAFERQMRLKDERLESFRQQLLNMDTESSNMKSELEVLKSSMKSEMDELTSKMTAAVEEKHRAERAMEAKDKELRALMKNNSKSTTDDYDTQQKVLTLLQKERNDARKKLEEVEGAHQRSLEEMEAEIQQKDHQLAVAEARLCQLRIQIDNERRATPNRTPDASTPPPEVTLPDRVYKIAVVSSQEADIKNALSTACSEVEKLADKIAEVRKQMASDENCDIQELMDQAAVVSNSGKKLSMLRNAISIEELNNTRTTLFRDTTVQLEAVSQALQKLPPPQETQPSTSYATNSGPPPEISEEAEPALDAEPEVSSGKEGEAMFFLESTDSDLEDRKGDSARKSTRRKTLKEFFLESPPELAVENPGLQPPKKEFAKKEMSSSPLQFAKKEMSSSPLQFAKREISSSPLQIAKKEISSSPLQSAKKEMSSSVLKKKKVLTELTPSQENVRLNTTKSPPLFATPLFDRIKSRRREFNKTREDIQVLGLALEVRKIEEQLFQIDRRCASQQQPESKATPGRLNKRYTALTGKVGHFAKQMGLTSAEKASAEVVTDNRLFAKKPNAAEIASLQQRAEAVGQSLAAIEAQATLSPAGVCEPQQQTGYSKERLVDTVKAHLAQVQRSLGERAMASSAPPTPARDTPGQQHSFVRTPSPLKIEKM